MAKAKATAFSSIQLAQFEAARDQRLDVKEIAVMMALYPAAVRRQLRFDGEELRVDDKGNPKPISLLVDTAGRRLRKHLRGGRMDPDLGEIGPGWLQREGVGVDARWFCPSRSRKPFDTALCNIFASHGWIAQVGNLWQADKSWTNL